MIKLLKKCAHKNPTVICQYKKYQYVNNRAVRMCHCTGQCPVGEGRKPVQALG
jgi:hypothetical protein